MRTPATRTAKRPKYFEGLSVWISTAAMAKSVSGMAEDRGEGEQQRGMEGVKAARELNHDPGADTGGDQDADHRSSARSISKV